MGSFASVDPLKFFGTNSNFGLNLSKGKSENHSIDLVNFMAFVDRTRINLGELKSKIAKRIGSDRTRLYFSYLNRLLAQKLSKVEFNKLCLSTLGRENIHLHNELIQSILTNAHNAKTPPPLNPKAVEDGTHPTSTPALLPPVWSNGDLFLTSPRKSRSAGCRERRIKDRSSSLGPNGLIVRENGILGHCDLKRLVQNHHGMPEEQPAKRPRIGSSLGIEVTEEGEEGLEQASVLDLCSRRNHLQAPLGIPFCPPSVGGAQRPLILAVSSSSSSSSVGRSFSSSSVGRSFSRSELCHTEDLMKRMEGVVRAQGLEGVTVDCANLLNNGLDSYLKQLIKSCFQLVVSRSEAETIKQSVYQQHPQKKPINGAWQGNNMHAPSSCESLDRRMEMKRRRLVSLQDFKVAMELNPKQLGEDWPLILEKICLHSFEE